uniref:Uncharacterized protein AlNc14C68G4784 n=1 Tax=Albugo laibachii Nc14 TaxID=890382 RepID=F0WDR5_9STRA|nr:conserved hypothetical protein [Albugo laibachii Nc14]|eukprot:CCA19342.1 conserved hypothetical protein [Albugo laibachii Nc14]
MHTSDCSQSQSNLFGQSQSLHLSTASTPDCLYPITNASKKRLSIDMKVRYMRMPEGSQSRSSIHRRSLQPIRRIRNPGNLSLNLSQVDKVVSFDENDGALRRQDHAGICSKITEFLFIGGSAAAKDFESLSILGITHVINCAACVVPAYFPDDFTYYNLRLRDHSSQDIAKHFYSIFNFIENARASGGKILVHCVKGISRSPTLAIAYIMWYKGVGVYQALEFVRHARPVVDPNAGFIFQLTEWEQLHLKGTIEYPPHPLVYRIELSTENDKITSNVERQEDRDSDENAMDISNKMHTTSSNQKEQPVTNNGSIQMHPMIVGPLNYMTQKHFFSPTNQNMHSIFVLSSPDYMCVWCGPDASGEQIHAAEEAKYLLQRFEAFPQNCDVVFHGQEHDAFWQLVSDRRIG